MRGFFKELTADRTLFRFYIITFSIIILTIVYILFNYRNIPPIIPLFNQLPWGNARLGVTPTIFIPVIIVFIIFIINISISTFVYRRTPLVARMLSVTSFLISLLTMLFIFRTLQIVI